MKINFAFVLLIILVTANLVNADISPGPGYTQVSADLIISTTEDLSDYRFFLDFSGDCREIKLKSNDTTTIPPQGGGARYSSGTLFAIPKKSLKDFGETLTFEQQQKLGDLIDEKKIDGVIELLSHGFHDEIKISDGLNWSYSTYRIEREAATIKAVKDKEIAGTVGMDVESAKRLYYSIAGGVILITAGIFAGGIYLFRKRRQKG